MDERTTEILNRFQTSWIKTEKYFDHLIDNCPGFDKLKPVRQFIAKLKQKGESTLFRLGTSMHTLLLSRSFEHGLRLDQKYIKIETIENNDFEVTLRDGDKIYRQYRIND